MSAGVGNAQGNAFVLTLTKQAIRGPNPSLNGPMIGPGARADRHVPLANGGGLPRPPAALKERDKHHCPPRRPVATHVQGEFRGGCAAPDVPRSTGCSRALERSVPPPSAALRRRNYEADHILSARLERTSVSTWRVHTRSSRLAGGLARPTSKAAMMNGSQVACCPPDLQLL